MGKGAILKNKNNENLYPMSSSDLIYDPITKRTVKEDLGLKVEEAPKDDKQYARFNGTWSEVAAGSVSELALIALTPNDEELKGVSVRVTTNEGDTVLDTTWQGVVLTAQIREGLQYTVAVGSKDGYIAPQSVTYTATKGSTRSINMTYIATQLRVVILSNQENDSDIKDVKATVTYGSTSIQVPNGGVVYLPLNVNVAITYPYVEGYKTPEQITYMHTGGKYEKTSIYRTQLLSLNVRGVSTTDDFKITGKDSNDNVLFIQTSLSDIHKIPWGTEYTIIASNVDGFNPPSTQNYIANSLTINAIIEYVKKMYKITAIRINQTITDPLTMITRIIDEGGVEEIRMNSHRYASTYTNETMKLKQLDDYNGNKYADGTDANLEEEFPDIWMKLPAFYWKMVNYADDIWEFYVAYGERPDDSYRLWDGKDLIGAFYATYAEQNGVPILMSSPYTDPVIGRSQTLYKQWARNTGDGFTLIKWKHHCMMAMLYYMTYNNTNSQEVLGEGDYSRITGDSIPLGMFDSSSEWMGTLVNFWGLEHWFGENYEIFDNVVTQKGDFIITEDDGTERRVSIPNKVDGYISKFKFGNDMDLIPVSANGSSTTGFCDYGKMDSGDYKLIVLRSYSNNYSENGISAISFGVTPDAETSSGYTTRLAYRGDFIIV